MKNIEKIICEVNGTMAMEGMPISEDDKNRIRYCLRDDNLFNETIKGLTKKHTVKPVKKIEHRK